MLFCFALLLGAYLCSCNSIVVPPHCGLQLGLQVELGDTGVVLVGEICNWLVCSIKYHTNDRATDTVFSL